jgi:predicted transcriptional regulator
MEAATTTMTVRLPVDVKQRLDRLAQTTARSKSWLASDAIAEYVKSQEWQIAEIEAGIREADAGEFAGADEVAAVFAKWSDAG